MDQPKTQQLETEQPKTEQPEADRFADCLEARLELHQDRKTKLRR